MQALYGLSRIYSPNRVHEVLFEGCFHLPPQMILRSRLRDFSNLRTVRIVNCFFFNPANIVTLDFTVLQSYGIQVLWTYSHPKEFAPHATPLARVNSFMLYRCAIYCWRDQMANNQNLSGRKVLMDSLRHTSMKQYLCQVLHFDETLSQDLPEFLDSSSTGDDLDVQFYDHFIRHSKDLHVSFDSQTRHQHMCPKCEQIIYAINFSHQYIDLDRPCYLCQSFYDPPRIYNLLDPTSPSYGYLLVSEPINLDESLRSMAQRFLVTDKDHYHRMPKKFLDITSHCGDRDTYTRLEKACPFALAGEKCPWKKKCVYSSNKPTVSALFAVGVRILSDI